MTRLIHMDLLDMETSSRGFFVTGEVKFLEPYNQSTARIGSNLNRLSQAVSGDSGTQEIMVQLLPAISEFQELLHTEIDSVQSKGKTEITPAELSNQKQHMDHLRHLLDALLQVRFSELQQRLSESHEKDNDFIYTLIMGTVLAVGGMLITTLIMLSLTAKSRAAEEEARESKERFFTVMNGVNDGLFDFEYENRTIYYSPAYKAMLGYTEEEHPNTLETFKNLIHPDDSEKVFEVSRRYRMREIPNYVNVFRMLHKDGSWHWILSRGVGIWNKNGEMTRLIGTHTDITVQKNREEDLRQLNLDLEGFTYIASHDLRSPLVNLKGFAGELEFTLKNVRPLLERIEETLNDEEKKLMKESFDKEIPEALNFIKKSVEKMDLLTSAVLDLSRIGMREFRPEPIDTNEVIKRCIDNLAYEITQKGTEVVCGTLPTIVCDRVAVEQIFGNLLDNAVKYLAPERKGKIEISSQTIGRSAVFSVKDNGRGITEADQNKVFEIFRRARNTGNVRGLGMGMAHVKATLRKIGGNITLESQVGAGTTFYVRLPLKNETN